MNRITLLIILCLLFSSTSCNKDDDAANNTSNNVTVTKELLLGKWFFIDNVVNGITYPYDHEDCEKDYVEFKDNGTTWQVDIDNLGSNCVPDFQQIGVYSIREGTLFMDGRAINIIELSSNKFSIKVEEHYDNDEILDTVVSNFDR